MTTTTRNYRHTCLVCDREFYAPDEIDGPLCCRCVDGEHRGGQLLAWVLLSWPAVVFGLMVLACFL